MALLQLFMYLGLVMVILMFMIAVHELGHYIAGKILGFKINEFAIGFGKPIYKRVSKKTGEIFSIRWFPLGGYCAFAGDDAAAGEGGSRKEAGVREKEKDAPQPKGIDFNKQPPWKRLIVLFSGGFFNFLSAILFATVLLMIVGYYQAIGFNGTTEGRQNAPAEQRLENVVAIHGIAREGETLERFTLLNSFNAVINGYTENDTLVIRVEFAPGTPQFEEHGKFADISGFKLVQLTAEDGSIYLGIGITYPKPIWQPMRLFKAIGYGTLFCLEIAWMILTFLGQLITGKVGFFGNVGGPITTVSMMTEVVSMGLLNILLLVPLISVNLALFNLLPIPALDGGRMVFIGIEWARGKPINPEIEGRIHLIGLIALLVLVLMADIGAMVVGGIGIFLLNCKLLL